MSFNQLHAECHNRIQYKKSCPVHGEVPANEIVKGHVVLQIVSFVAFLVVAIATFVAPRRIEALDRIRRLLRREKGEDSNGAGSSRPSARSY